MLSQKTKPVPAARTPRAGGADPGACIAALNGALSQNTERAVRADLAIYAAWCDERGAAALPARPETIAAFVDAMSASRAPATVRRYVASIAVAHRATGHAKTLGSPVITRALRRMHRRRGRRQEQAGALTWPLRERLIGAAGGRLIDARDRALVAVAYDTLLRRSELAALEVSDLVGEVDGSATVLVRRGKTDAEGRGAVVYVGRGHAPAGARVAGSLRHHGRARVPLAVPRAARQRAGPESDSPHLQGHGAARRSAGRGGRGPVGAQHAGRGDPGHDRLRHRAAGHPAGGALEEHDHGEPLRGAPCWHGAAAARSWPGCCGAARVGGVGFGPDAGRDAGRAAPWSGRTAQKAR